MLIVGDSLAFGMQPFLGEMLGGRVLTWDVVRGRTTPNGMRALRIALLTLHPQTVVISLGTNDGPDPRRFSNRVRRTLRSVPDACIVWPTIWRPRRKGAYRGLNRVLRREARRDPRLTVVDWDRTVSKKTVVLPDGLHPSVPSYRVRSSLVAVAVVRGCVAAPPS